MIDHPLTAPLTAGPDGEDFPDPTHTGPCQEGEVCRVWDWSASPGPGGQLAAVRPRPTDDNWVSHRFIKRPIYQGNWETVVFLAHAVELSGHGGNNNGFCEVQETCLYTPNIGAQQPTGELCPVTGGPSTVDLYEHRAQCQ